MTCRALRPRGCPTSLPKVRCRMLSSGQLKPSTIPQRILNGALSLQPEGLRPTTSLSTLNRDGYPYRLKTRYQVRWVPASWAALSAASKTAPRGAQAIESVDLIVSFHQELSRTHFRRSRCSPIIRRRGFIFQRAGRAASSPQCFMRLQWIAFVVFQCSSGGHLEESAL